MRCNLSTSISLCLQHEPFPSREDHHGFRDIGKHDFRSVLLHPMLLNGNLPFTDLLWPPYSQGFLMKKENGARECARLPWEMLQSKREKDARDFHSNPLSKREHLHRRQRPFDLWLILRAWPHTPQAFVETSRQADHVPESETITRSDHNTGNSMHFSFRTVRGFFYVPENCEQWRVARRGLWVIILIPED